MCILNLVCAKHTHVTFFRCSDNQTPCSVTSQNKVLNLLYNLNNVTVVKKREGRLTHSFPYIITTERNREAQRKKNKESKGK
jgi:hypothetical protein